MALRQPKSAWQTISWREGTAAPLASRFACLRVRPVGEKLACESFQLGLPNAQADNAAMGIRTRGLDISINAKRQEADRVARAEAKGVVDRWNEHLAAGRELLWSPTIRAALIAGTPWLDVYRALDLRKVDRHPLASVGTMVLGLRCSWCTKRPDDAATGGLALHA